jgi:hypothetical protein
MTLLGFPIYDCSNESDVEQKFGDFHFNKARIT